MPLGIALHFKYYKHEHGVVFVNYQWYIIWTEYAKLGHDNQIEYLTENRDILNEYTLSLCLENVVFSNIAISKMRPVLISPKHVFKQKVASGTGDYLVRINKESSPVNAASYL